MNSLLDALQEGRLIELPDNDKMDSLKFLAHIIEAIPSVPNGTDVAGAVAAREQSANTALGNGFACPHARVPYDEELICSVGWSPSGIDYGAPDNLPIHVIVMYLIPNNQRNHYLKEISLLAKALMADSHIESLRAAKDLNAVRNYLLDLISKSKDLVGFDARARMIQLESRATQSIQQIQLLSNILIEPVTIVSSPAQAPIILSQHKELVELLDRSATLVESLTSKGFYEQNGWRIVKKNSSDYQFNKSLYECIAVKIIAR